MSDSKFPKILYLTPGFPTVSNAFDPAYAKLEHFGLCTRLRHRRTSWMIKRSRIRFSIIF